ncbi:MAG: DEAD/DEAH box helicase family protein [Gemmataceae bacterium]
MLDFGKHIKKRAGERPTDPLVIYEGLDRQSDIGPLRPAQLFVLNEWHTNRRKDRDLIVKLHTGHGKTAVGLLMLQSRLNEGAGPALYLCPNKFLVDQTCQQAQRFGFQVINGNKSDDLPPAFLNGQETYVCTIQKLFNGMTKFGLRGDSVQVGTLLMDDCHACIDSIKQACSFMLKAGTPAYQRLLALFAADLTEQGAGTFTDIQNGDYDALLPVPYWAWSDRRDEVTAILADNKQDESIKFAWPILKDMIDRCCCVVSGTGIEISPHVPPLAQFGSYHGAKKRIFMSATVTDDSFLVKGLRLSAATITNPIIYPKEKWFGEKMILIPSLIDGITGRDDVIKSFANPVEGRRHGVVVLCPSKKAAEPWGEAGAEVAERGTIGASIQRLLEGQYDQPLCVYNRYDGIDLPDRHCRILVLDSKPFSGGLIDRHVESCRPGSKVTAQRTARMIEQGIGRGVRGEKDFCAVILTGGDLVRAVQRDDVKRFYSSQTRKQIEIGIEIVGFSAELVAQHSVPGLTITWDGVKKLLSRDEGWKEFYADRMSEVVMDKPNQEMLKLYAVELDAETKAEEGRYVEAKKLIQAMLDGDADMAAEDRGWYTQEMARLLYKHSKAESATLQCAAHRLNHYLLKPKEGVVVKKLEPLSQRRVAAIIGWVQRSQDYQDLMVRAQAILSDLRFGVESDTFERALDDLGRALGFAAERPDKAWGKGPDNLWCLKAGCYLLTECKNEVKLERDEIAKAETGQMNNAYAWFTAQYPGAEARCVMVIPTRKMGEAAGFNMAVTVLRQGGLRRLTRAVQNFFKEFSGCDLQNLDPAAVQKWLAHHQLDTDSVLSAFTDQIEK